MASPQAFVAVTNADAEFEVLLFFWILMSWCYWRINISSPIRGDESEIDMMFV